MTRSTRSLLSIVAVLAITAALAPVAVADYSSANSLVDSEGESSASSGYSSPNSILADGRDAAGPRLDSGFATVSSITGSGPVAPQGDGGFSTVSSITGSDPTTVSPPQLAASPSDGFDWGDASIGAAIGVSLAALLGLALTTTRRRQRTAVQPSV